MGPLSTISDSLTWRAEGGLRDRRRPRACPTNRACSTKRTCHTRFCGTKPVFKFGFRLARHHSDGEAEIDVAVGQLASRCFCVDMGVLSCVECGHQDSRPTVKSCLFKSLIIKVKIPEPSCAGKSFGRPCGTSRDMPVTQDCGAARLLMANLSPPPRAWRPLHDLAMLAPA
jgi:hypothetical protein